MSKVAGALAVVGGVLLVIGGFSGTAAGLLGTVQDAVHKWMPDNQYKDNIVLALTIMIYISLFGGFAVILGGYLMWKGMDFFGKVMVWLGTGIGMFTLAISAIVAWATGHWDAFVSSSMTMVGIGLVLSIVARWIA